MISIEADASHVTIWGQLPEPMRTWARFLQIYTEKSCKKDEVYVFTNQRWRTEEVFVFYGRVVCHYKD